VKREEPRSHLKVSEVVLGKKKTFCSCARKVGDATDYDNIRLELV